MRTKSYCIKLSPIPWKRPSLNGNRFYDAQAKDKLAFGLFLAKQHNDEPLFDTAVHLDIIFYMRIPKKGTARLPNAPHYIKPDLDNLCKFLLDAIKDVIILDDRIICSLSAKKVYDKVPRTELVITEVV